jgi:ABC-type multidrug transport system ATPase subunit/ABC-type multidrug transport system permease subunit
MGPEKATTPSSEKIDKDLSSLVSSFTELGTDTSISDERETDNTESTLGSHKTTRSHSLAAQGILNRMDQVKLRKLKRLEEQETGQQGFINMSTMPSENTSQEDNRESNNNIIKEEDVKMYRRQRGGKARPTSTLYNPKNSIHIVWSDIVFEIKKGKTTRRILDGIHGDCKPGEMLALMGGSGAGKTTLLNALAGRLVDGNLSGSILVNGHIRTKNWKHVTGYVEQEDLLYSTLTVKETLVYAATLRLPFYLKQDQKVSRALQVMKELGLSHAADTRIGDGIDRGVSGGEKRRVSIGIELIANPRLLFLDEPTSGLDAYTAYGIMESISILAYREARTVIMTLHQPREDIFALFDKVLVLAQGKVAYFGHIRHVIPYFEKLGYQIDDAVNPADFIIDLTSVDKRTEEMRKSSMARVENVLNNWSKIPGAGNNWSSTMLHVVIDKNEENAPEGAGLSRLPNPLDQMTPALDILEPDEQKRRSLILENRMLAASTISFRKKSAGPVTAADLDQNTWWTEFSTLFSQLLTHEFRRTTEIFAIAVQTFFTLTLIGFTFFQLGLTQPDIQARLGSLFYLMATFMFITLSVLYSLIPSEKPLIRKDRYAGAYRTTAYFLSKVLASAPLRCLSSLIVSLSIYYIIGYNSSAKCYFIYVGIVILFTIAGLAFGMLIGSLSATPSIGSIIGQVVFMFITLYAGNLVTKATIPPQLSWLRFISVFYYGYLALTQNEFTGLTFICSNGEAPIDNYCLQGYATGEQVLEAFELQEFSITTSSLILVGYVILAYIIAYFALRISTKPRMKLI